VKYGKLCQEEATQLKWLSEALLLLFIGLCTSINHISLLLKISSVFFISFRFLDPDPPYLLEELSKSMGKKFHQLNKAITTLVRANLN